MSSKHRLPLLLLTLGLLAAFCNMPSAGPAQRPPDAMATMVAATLQALTPQATPTAAFAPTSETTFTPVPTPTPGTGEVSGRACFRSGMTALAAYFENTATGQVVELALTSGQPVYKIDLPVGTYRAYGWPPDFSIGVLYEGGTFQVFAGQKTTGIDLCDWFHGPFDVPYPPGYTPAQTVGSISGGIYGYPGSASAKLTIVAFNQTTYFWYWVSPAPGVRAYTITNLPPGTYQVVAYDDGGSAGGTAVNIVVIAGQVTAADIANWGGSYPANPLK